MNPMIIIPRPETLTIVLNSSLEGFLVALNTRAYSLKDDFNLYNFIVITQQILSPTLTQFLSS